ncbi:MAG: glycosyltransferase, partial [Prevotella sp.]|nr:glycosyltransferase [Prevotella sp.]
MIRFSIITITWNAAHCVQRTLDSVGGQTYQQLEHLIIDGVSTDATLQMVETYRQQCPYPVIVSSEPDSGIYDAMNKGLKRAT